METLADIKDHYTDLKTVPLEVLCELAIVTHGKTKDVVDNLNDKVNDLKRQHDAHVQKSTYDFFCVAEELNKVQRKIKRIDKNKADKCALKRVRQKLKKRDKQITSIQWEVANRTILVSNVKTLNDPKVIKDSAGREHLQYERESMNETLDIVRKEICPVFDVDPLMVVKAYRIPRPRTTKSKNPPRLTFTVANYETAMKIMTGLKVLKNHEKGSRWHFEKDVPAMLRDLKRIGDSISHEYRQEHKNAIVRISFPGDKLTVKVKNTADEMWHTLDNLEMEHYLTQAEIEILNAEYNEDREDAREDADADDPDDEDDVSDDDDAKWSSIMTARKRRADSSMSEMQGGRVQPVPDFSDLSPQALEFINNRINQNSRAQTPSQQSGMSTGPSTGISTPSEFQWGSGNAW